MKALTLTQPWATLVILGEKCFETRSWRSWYRGPLAIHAAKGFPKWAKDLCMEEPFASVLAKHGYAHWKQLPVVSVLGIVDLMGCVPTEHVAGSSKFPGRFPVSEHELDFGDYTDGRWAWSLENVRRFEKPIPITGALGLWEWVPPEGVVQVLNSRKAVNGATQ